MIIFYKIFRKGIERRKNKIEENGNQDGKQEKVNFEASRLVGIVAQEVVYLWLFTLYPYSLPLSKRQEETLKPTHFD